MVRVHENHCISDDSDTTENVFSVYMPTPQYDKYLIFCKCGEIVRVRDNPDNYVICCDNHLTDYRINVIKHNGYAVKFIK